MKYFIVILLVLFATSTLAAPRSVWRSTDKEDDYRTAVTVIDMGMFKDTAFSLNSFVLTCIDGVKVYTTTKDSSVHNIILPGRCDGKLEIIKPKVIYKNIDVPIQYPPETKEDFLNW